MGNQNERQSASTLPSLNNNDQQSLTRNHSESVQNSKFLKSSGTTPNLFKSQGVPPNNMRHKSNLSQLQSTPLDGRPPKSSQSHMTGAIATAASTTPQSNQQTQRAASKNKQQILSAMTSRVLQREKQMSSATNLHSFCVVNSSSSTTNLNSGTVQFNHNSSGHINNQNQNNIINRNGSGNLPPTMMMLNQRAQRFQRTQELNVSEIQQLNTTGMLQQQPDYQQQNNSGKLQYFNNSEQVKRGGLQFSSIERSEEKFIGNSTTMEPFQNISNKVQQQQMNQQNTQNLQRQLNFNSQVDNYQSSTTPNKHIPQQQQQQQDPQFFSNQSNFFPTFQHQQQKQQQFPLQHSSYHSQGNPQQQSLGRMHSKSAHIIPQDQNQPPLPQGYMTLNNNKTNKRDSFNSNQNQNIPHHHNTLSATSLQQHLYQANQQRFNNNFNSYTQGNDPNKHLQYQFDSNNINNNQHKMHSGSVLSASNQQTTTSVSNNNQLNHSANKVVVNNQHQSNYQTTTSDQNDVYKTQQRLLKQLKNSRKKMSTNSSHQNTQPKQRKTTNGSQVRQSAQMTQQNENIVMMNQGSASGVVPPTHYQMLQSMRQNNSSQKQLGTSFNQQDNLKSQNMTPYTNIKHNIDQQQQQQQQQSPSNNSNAYFSQDQNNNFYQQIQTTQNQTNNLTTERNNYFQQNGFQVQNQVSYFQQNLDNNYDNNSSLHYQPIVDFKLQQQQQRYVKFGDSGQLMPADLVMTLISFDPTLFQKLLMLSPSWHTSALQAIDEHCNSIENQFIQTYIDYLFFKQSYTQTMPIKFCGQRGLRLDRVLECEVLPSKYLQPNGGNKTLRIAYQYKVYGDTTTYKAEFKFDTCKTGSKRLTWMHSDTVNNEIYTQPIQQVCFGDNIEFSMSLISLQGLVQEVKWDQPVVTETPKLSVLNYDKDWAKKTSFFRKGDTSIKIHCDLNRICELEDAVVEWYEEAYYQRRSDLYNLDYLRELFEVKRVEYAGVDGAICKVLMVAKTEGIIDKNLLGLEIRVKNTRTELTNEIKRLGYLKDREQPIQLRIGDQIILYISKSTA